MLDDKKLNNRLDKTRRLEYTNHGKRKITCLIYIIKLINKVKRMECVKDL